MKVLTALTGLALAAAFFFVKNNPPFCDEYLHYIQSLCYINKPKALQILAADPNFRLVDPAVEVMAVGGNGVLNFIPRNRVKEHQGDAEIRPIDTKALYYDYGNGLRMADTKSVNDVMARFVPVRLLEKDFLVLPNLTTLPGYNMVLGYTARLFGSDSISAFRGITFGLSLLAMAAFGYLCRLEGGDGATMRWLHFVWLPIIFPFFPLVYTDVFSMTFFFVSLALVRHRYYDAAGMVAFASLTVRQTNIVWMLFLSALIYVEENRWELDSRKFKSWLWKCRTFWAGTATFAAFVVWNGGVALGDKAMHPTFSFHLGNVYFCLFLHFFLFLPLHLSNLGNIPAFMRERKWVLPLLGAFFMLYWTMFRIDHPYNYAPYVSVFLRSRALQFFTSRPEFRPLFFIPVALAAMSLCVTRLKRPSFYLVYPFTALSLLPIWLIEQRYYMLPFSLFILFKEKSSARTDYATLTYYVLISAVLFYGIQKQYFFL